jgi:hypothetical protein
MQTAWLNCCDFANKWFILELKYIMKRLSGNVFPITYVIALGRIIIIMRRKFDVATFRVDALFEHAIDNNGNEDDFIVLFSHVAAE